MTEATVWGIHAGRTGDADVLFLKQGGVAIGWAKMGNLAELPATRDAFRTRYSQAYPEAKPGAIATVSEKWGQREMGSEWSFCEESEILD